ncbi:hypothetical protein ANCCEY_10955 [Ancylostoma ceylanicum]|uniref:CCHC-type domain-containing protein n=2 Tax=Ancylostoma ceylanicum TaxID=53326 RepID=A0A0D6LJ53_9BILA|nr:hypothetical protein ANCCEY_10955 [Ancylostoma ceylanicum]
MAPTLKSLKGRLTKMAKVLEERVRDTEPLLAWEIPTLQNGNETIDHLKLKRVLFTERLNTLTEELATLHSLAEAFDQTFEALTTEQQQSEQASHNEYLEAAWDQETKANTVQERLREKVAEINMRIECLVSIQQQREREREDERRMRDRPSGEATPASTSSTFMQTVLLRLTVPKFSGKRQEWDMFWALFKTNIDEQPISSMMKYNYLLQAVTGEARQVAGRYQLIEANHNMVVNALKQKYGRDSSIVEDLLAEFGRCKASGPSTRQQIALLDHIAAIVQQLSSKGENTNTKLFLNSVLRKFDSHTQTKALERRESLNDMSEWTWSKLYTHLSEKLEVRDKVERAQEALNQKPQIPPPPSQSKMTTGRPTSQCIYCKATSHRSAECREVPESERKTFLVRDQLCINCGRANYRVTDCT